MISMISMICPPRIYPAVCVVHPLIIYRRTPVRYLIYPPAPVRAASGGGAPTSRLTCPLACRLTSRPPSHGAEATIAAAIETGHQAHGRLVRVGARVGVGVGVRVRVWDLGWGLG